MSEMLAVWCEILLFEFINVPERSLIGSSCSLETRDFDDYSFTSSTTISLLLTARASFSSERDILRFPLRSKRLMRFLTSVDVN